MTGWLIDTALYTGLLIAVVLLVRRPVARHFGPTIAYALWALPLIRLVLPPLVLPASMAPAPEAAPAALDPALMALLMAADEPGAATAAGPATASVPGPAWEWGDLALALWLGGAALFLAWRIRNYLRLRRELLAEALPVGDVGDIRLVETPAVDSPIAFGVFDKVVALPPRFMVLADRYARDLAIAHELAHHRGRDIAANFAAQPLLALHWFNPIAWMGWRAMRRDQEAACDARLMAGADRAQRAAYANVIAGFAAGPRLALPLPLACPILGEKSIIHRLRSLSMDTVSKPRRLAGRMLLAASAVALPLTASVSYAEQSAVSEIELAPSAPAAPAPPRAPELPSAPAAPKEVRIVKLVGEGEETESVTGGHAPHDKALTFRLHRDGDGPMPEGERRVMRIETDRELTEEQKKKFEAMAREASSRDWSGFAEKQAELAVKMAEMEKNMPLVETRCDDDQATTRTSIDADGRKRIVVCERNIERKALASAAAGLRQARASIAVNTEMSAKVRAEILKDLDKEIARIESERKES